MPLTPAQFAEQFGMAPTAQTSPENPTPAILYTAAAGDRWDWIAWKMYGDVSMMGALILANPQIPAWSALAAGTPVYAPPLALAPAADAAALPPWRQTP
jgi:phage tail protein X